MHDNNIYTNTNTEMHEASMDTNLVDTTYVKEVFSKKFDMLYTSWSNNLLVLLHQYGEAHCIPTRTLPS